MKQALTVLCQWQQRFYRADNLSTQIGAYCQEDCVIILVSGQKVYSHPIIKSAEAKFNTNSPINVKRLALQNACHQAEISSGKAVIAVEDSVVKAKSIQLPLDLTPQEIELHLLVESERYFGISGDQLYFDYEINLDVSNCFQQIEVIVAPRQEIDSQIKLLEAVGLKIIAVDLYSAALERGLRQIINDNNISLIVLVNEAHLEFILWQNGKIKHCQRDNSSDQSASSLTRQIIQQYQWAQLLLSKPPATIKLFGSDEDLRGLIPQLQAEISIPIQTLNFKSLKFNDVATAANFRKRLSPYLVSYGLAQW